MSARALILLSLCACAHAAPPIRPDWVAIDNKNLEARWRAQHCAEPNGQKCDAFWLVKDDVGAMLKAQREMLEQGDK